MKEELSREEYRLLEQIESYISNHSNVLFSLAICPECEVKVRAEFEREKRQM